MSCQAFIEECNVATTRGAICRTACCSHIVKGALQDALDQLLEQCLQDHAYLERELKLVTPFNLLNSSSCTLHSEAKIPDCQSIPCLC